MKRVEFILPEVYFYKLKAELDRFNMEPKELYNNIFSEMDLFKLEPVDFMSKATKSLKFYLRIKVEEKYDQFFEEKYNILNGLSNKNINNKQFSILDKITQTQTELLRAVFINFLNKSSTDREKLIFKDIYNKVQEAIVGRNKIKIKYKEEDRVVEPYFIKTVEGHPFNLVYCYSYKHKQNVTFHLSKIEKIDILNETWENYEERKVKSKKLNFRLYESERENENFLIKFDKDKIWMFKNFIYNRPNNYREISCLDKGLIDDLNIKYPDLKSIKLEDNEILYDINTSEIKLQTYLPQFLDYFEVLYPKSLRKYFKERLSNALKKYK